LILGVFNFLEFPFVDFVLQEAVTQEGLCFMGEFTVDVRDICLTVVVAKDAHS